MRPDNLEREAKSMNLHQPNTETGDFVSVTQQACPHCKGDLIRTPRRPMDRLLNWFTPLYRYRCSRYACQWVGNLLINSD